MRLVQAPRKAANAANRAWSPALAFAVLAALVAWLYHPVLLNLARQWWDEEDYSHGFLIPLMSAYFVWERREQLGKLSAAPALFGLVLLVGGVGLFSLGHVAADLYTMRVSLLVIIAALILYLLGRRHLWTLAFPVAYLLFMIPPPAIVFNAVALPLQSFAARAATAAMQFLGIPVLREGNLLTLAHTTLEVAEACSGIRSLVTLLALAATYAYLTQKGFWRRSVLFVSAVPIAIVANAGRVAGTGVLAHFFGAGVADGFFHTFSGWLVFAAAFLLLFVEGVVLNRILRQRRAAPASVAVEGCEPVPGGVTQSLGRGALHPWLRVAVAGGVLAGGILFLQLRSHGEAVPIRGSFGEFPLHIGQLRGVDEGLEPAIINKLGVTDFMMRLYTAPGRLPIWLYVGYYESQRTGAIIHSPKNCLPGSGWSIVRSEQVALDVPGAATPRVVNRVIVANRETRQLVLYWYQERGRIVASEYQGKVYMVWDSITRNRTDGALVRVSVPVLGSEEEASRQAVEFSQDALPLLTRFLPG